MSHPMWVRGLKPWDEIRALWPFCVAPYVGAWIETLFDGMSCGQIAVAPYVGAWIETGYGFR